MDGSQHTHTDVCHTERCACLCTRKYGRETHTRGQLCCRRVRINTILSRASRGSFEM